MKRRLKTAAAAFALGLTSSVALAQDEPTEGFVERPDGARIHYTIRGEGSPMMLIHGYPLNEGLFRDNVDALAEAGFAVVTPSLRGFGQSEAPSDSASIDAYSDDMLAVMDQLQIDQGIVLGMSMGGWTLFDMVRKAPGRFTGLIFNDTAAVPAPPAEAALWEGLARQVRDQDVASIVPFLVKDMFTGRTRMENQELVDYIGSLMEEASVNGAAGGGIALAERPDLTEVLSGIEVPTLLIYGIEDTLTPVSIAQQMADTIPGARLEIIDGASHASILEAPDAANEAILGWIDENALDE